MTPPIDVNLPQGVWQRLQTAKDVVNQSVNSITNSAQQLGQSLQETATTTTDKAMDTVTTKLEESLQTAEQFKSTTSGAVQGAITSSVSDWLTQHPGIFRLVQILSWAANHPIISVIILLFIIAFSWSIIKAIVGLIETASWSILKVPLKLIQALIQVSFFSVIKVGRFAVKKVMGTNNTDNVPVLVSANPQENSQEKKQRLAEISSRLEAIQKEQNELLQEAAELIANDKIDIEISNIKQPKTFESHLG
ncbi:hypothetical protein WKK05_30335 [Nostoc sp. UHCC 0302]|uniref:hypothetical protein n=1 Tax=Nostoc sp. UHCC 0302 TaxID=3134896 RepID=UPI00311CB549